MPSPAPVNDLPGSYKSSSSSSHRSLTVATPGRRSENRELTNLRNQHHRVHLGVRQGARLPRELVTVVTFSDGGGNYDGGGSCKMFDSLSRFLGRLLQRDCELPGRRRDLDRELQMRSQKTNRAGDGSDLGRRVKQDMMVACEASRDFR
ncbi:hypothetical protein TIFTF001_015082 [Ficus carica]|uniref:Uncharacterized protein n=1 Tax=Ficus carica TaxID=3494 RepID=A0AA88AKY2_FICCA|nr:hypothetical protein TIFTF001_015082 [Ficus carica]